MNPSRRASGPRRQNLASDRVMHLIISTDSLLRSHSFLMIPVAVSTYHLIRKIKVDGSSLHFLVSSS